MLITTERLVLRRFRAADAPVLADYRSDPAVARELVSYAGTVAMMSFPSR